jgi:formiminotetrahydrofolate cyclodeaminase
MRYLIIPSTTNLVTKKYILYIVESNNTRDINTIKRKVVQNTFTDIRAGYSVFQTKISRIYSTIKMKLQAFTDNTKKRQLSIKICMSKGGDFE